jgi:hypothetical protein
VGREKGGIREDEGLLHLRVLEMREMRVPHPRRRGEGVGEYFLCFDISNRIRLQLGSPAGVALYP